MRVLANVLAAALSVLPVPAGTAGETNPRTPTLVEQLLAEAAPWKDWKLAIEERNKALPAEKRWHPGEPPPDDAPLSVLRTFWLYEANWNRPDGVPAPSPRVAERLLAVCEREPARLLQLLVFLPSTPEGIARLERLYDGMAGGDGETVEEDAREESAARGALREWLELRSARFLDRLAALVAHAEFDWQDERWERRLAALAEHDWGGAEPVLKALEGRGAPQVAAYALSLRFRRAVASGNGAEAGVLRAQMQRIAEDRHGSAYARECMITALLAADWPGRERWCEALLADQSLWPLDHFLESHHKSWPVATSVSCDPEVWLPLMTRLVGHRERAVHEHAVGCLLDFAGGPRRPDALRPLLPWLTAPTWGPSSGRVALVQELARVDMSESVPGLCWILEHEPSGECAAYAVLALARYRDARAATLRRQALERSRDDPRRDRETIFGLVETLRASGSISAEDAIASLDALVPTWHDGKLERYVRLGELSARVHAEQALKEFRHEGRLHVRGLVAMLEGRDALRSGFPEELAAIVKRGGEAAGAAAVISGDANTIAGVLSGNDGRAKAVLLACACVAGQALPRSAVGAALRESDTTLARAAECYLAYEDGPAARALLRASHPGKILVFGRSPWHGDTLLGPIGEDEERLVGEIGDANGPDELFALACQGECEGPLYVVRRRGESFDLQFRPGHEKPSSTRRLSDREAARFRAFMAEREVDTLPALEQGIMDGVDFGFLHLTKQEGVRVYMDDPDWGKACGSVYSLLVEEFRALTEP